MTAQEMYTAFKIEVDKVDSLALPNFLISEVEYFLNKAQLRIVKQRYGYNNSTRTGAEVTEKRTNDLRMLIQQATLIPQATGPYNLPNGFFIKFPDGVTVIDSTTNAPYPEYMFELQSKCNITYTDHVGNSVTDFIPVRNMTHDEYDDACVDPFNDSYNQEIPRLVYQDKIELITDGTFTITSLKLRYIMFPPSISITNNINCVLSDELHGEIVVEAKEIALEDIESQRFQSSMALDRGEE